MCYKVSSTKMDFRKSGSAKFKPAHCRLEFEKISFYIFCRTRNDGKARSVPIVPLLQLPYGEEMELENQCAMLVDFITNYTG